jgi:molecular chaperone DnaK (HSP70)
VSAPRFAVGIDLGTTHTALAYVDLDLAEGDEAPPAVFGVPQLVAQGALEARPLLPSFLYLPHASEGPQSLPWHATRAFVVGEHARARGAEAPARLVSSAKSWLCHPGVDRRAPILPPTPAGAPIEQELAKVSPVEASRRYLEHLREAWDARFVTGAGGDPECALALQEVVLTVPASFDAGARELTAEAARLAGLANVTLLEEPQAALYSWIEQTHGSFRRTVAVGDVILVIDVGGGTTDFSAIVVEEQDGNLELRRVAVGDHILLGGDNMDLALAHVVRQKLSAAGKELDPWQAQALVHQARAAKEQLLGRDDLAEAPIVIAGRGSKLLGGAIRSELTRSEIVQYLVDGFFPQVASSDRPKSRARVGLTQLGLPYANDPGVTRHLAAFLGRQVNAVDATTHASGATFLRPTKLLFNGGVMKATPLRDRLIDALSSWLAAEGATAPEVLQGADLDLAVARGAAYYAYAKRGRGVRVRGGTARAYYVGVEGAVPAVPGLEPPITAICVAPFGMEEGTRAEMPPQELGLVVGEPVRFRFFGSSVRRDDRPGHALERWAEGELDELPPIEATLGAEGRREGDVVPVHLQSSVTEVGTLLLEAVPSAPSATSPTSAGERWKLELNVRE